MPEQTAATLLGVKCIGFAAVTNPATGTTDGSWVHDGEHNLMAAKKCLGNMKKIIWRVIEKFDFNPDYQFKFSLTDSFNDRSLQVKKVSRSCNQDSMKASLVSKIKMWVSHEPDHVLHRVVWLQSEGIFKEFMATIHHQIRDMFYINLSQIGMLRTRSCKQNTNERSINEFCL